MAETKTRGEVRGEEFVVIERWWKEPTEATSEIAAEARSILALPSWAPSNAEAKDLRDWLMHLAVLCAGRMELEEARGKCGAYVVLLQGIARAILTKDALKRAARAYKFFPSFSEIAAFLEAETEIFTEHRRRLAIIAGLDGTATESAQGIWHDGEGV